MRSRLPNLLLFLVLSAVVSSYAEVTTEVTEGVYVLPVAELASTRTYPDIITLQNDLIRIQLIPNRGRVLVELTSLLTNTNFLYRNLIPDPMILPSGLHGVEFGGYYLSLPWNTRDRQPFDLQYEITHSGPDEAEVYLSGNDIFARTLTECRVRLRDGSPVVEMEITLTNTSSRRPNEVDFRDFTLFSVETDGKMRNSVLLPAERVEVLSSEGQWLGNVGEQVSWAESVPSWVDIRDHVHVRTVGPMRVAAYGIMYPELHAACVQLWQPEDFFSTVEVWSWGEQYRQYKGAGPYFGLSSGKTIELQPEERISVTVYMAVLENLQGDLELSSLYEKARSYLEK